MIDEGHNVDQPMTQTGIALWSLIMCPNFDVSNESIYVQKTYVSILKTVKKKRPDLMAKDNAGRSCFHLAASANNIIGLKFLVTLMIYLE